MPYLLQLRQGWGIWGAKVLVRRYFSICGLGSFPTLWVSDASCSLAQYHSEYVSLGLSFLKIMLSKKASGTNQSRRQDRELVETRKPNAQGKRSEVLWVSWVPASLSPPTFYFLMPCLFFPLHISLLFIPPEECFPLHYLHRFWLCSSVTL